MDFWTGLITGGLVGVVMAVVLQPPLEDWWRRIRSATRRRLRWLSPHDTVTDELGVDGFHQLMVWSPARPLDPRRHHSVIAVQDASRIPLVLHGLDATLVDTQAIASGVAGSVVGYRVDHGEAGPASQEFVIEVSEAPYASGMAFQRVLSDDDTWRRVLELVRDQGPDALASLPANTFFINLSLTSREGRTLALRRASGAVATAKGLWTLGSSETMAALPTQPGAAPEDLFALARRAANEEFGLYAYELGPIWFTWLGIGQFHGLFCVAHTTTHLTEVEVIERIGTSYAGFEADAARWLPLDGPELAALGRGENLHGWLPLTRIAARDLRRIRNDLERMPVRR